MIKFFVLLFLFLSFSTRSTAHLDQNANVKIDATKKVLNDLKDEINAEYGLLDGSPRINSGPCGAFAYLFYQEWNKNFQKKVTISFIMSADSSECYHVLIKLPNKHYYDGGNGELTRRDLVRGYEDGMYIIDMIEFDYDLLDGMAYGLKREYERCPNYSNVKTAEIIQKHLRRIKK